MVDTEEPKLAAYPLVGRWLLTAQGEGLPLASELHGHQNQICLGRRSTETPLHNV
jgi:hypothetical protein